MCHPLRANPVTILIIALIPDTYNGLFVKEENSFVGWKTDFLEFFKRKKSEKAFEENN